jgi:hypothetical protein
MAKSREKLSEVVMFKRFISMLWAAAFFGLVNVVALPHSALAISSSPFSPQKALTAVSMDMPIFQPTVPFGPDRGQNSILSIADQRQALAVHSLLTQLAADSRQLYSLAHLNQWLEAGHQVQPMSQLIEKLSDLEFPRADLTQLQSYLLDLQGAVAANSHQTLLDANQLAFLATTKAVQMDRSMPIEVINLDYYTHSLDPWVKMGNIEQLKNISRQIRQNWESLRPALEHQHQSEHLTNYYDGLISLLEKAQTPHEYTLVTPPLLAEVSQLRTVLSL